MKNKETLSEEAEEASKIDNVSITQGRQTCRTAPAGCGTTQHVVRRIWYHIQ